MFRAVSLLGILLLSSGCAGPSTQVTPAFLSDAVATQRLATSAIDVPGKAWKVHIDLPPWDQFPTPTGLRGSVLSARLREGGVVTMRVMRQPLGVTAEACFDSVRGYFQVVADRFKAPFHTQLHRRYVLVTQTHSGAGGRQFWHAFFTHDGQCLQLDVSRQLPALPFEKQALAIIDSVKFTESGSR